ncbi:MAG: class I SAM-dependent methyltransferase [Deferrisomatales bacterium]|nr:class I SAM-dependent methyltransferase [Deferrisomatales bacterium]
MTTAVTVAAFVAVGLTVTLAYTLRTGISPVPTSPRVRAALLASLPADLEGTVFELGSGWGGLAFALAHRYPSCPVRAYELSPLPWAVSRLRALFARTPNLRLLRADFHRAPLGTAVLVVCYLYPGGMARLRPKLAAELPAGALVVSHFFPVPGWKPLRVHRADDEAASRIFVYRLPAAGTDDTRPGDSCGEKPFSGPFPMPS